MCTTTDSLRLQREVMMILSPPCFCQCESSAKKKKKKKDHHASDLMY